ncbi:MAG TPA: hypothetical protein PLU17_04580 [Chitinophagaceae bacterium]|nr:hypothetical protein [Chitinophagaceae bacterium]
MLEQLFSLIKNESQNEIINNPVIPNEQNNHAVGLATDSIFSGLQGALANGGLKDVLGMFTGGGNTSSNNPIVGGIINNFVGSLMQKFGIDSPMATSIASSLIPSIIGKMVNKTNDPNDNGFDINGIIGALTGSNASQGGGVQLPGVQNAQEGGIDFGGILKTLTSGGLDSNKDGSIGIDDLAGMIGKVTSGAQQQNQQQQPSGGGGIMDLLKGFMN